MHNLVFHFDLEGELNSVDFQFPPSFLGCQPSGGDSVRPC